MGHSHTSILIHYVWSTKARLPLIHQSWLPRLHGYFSGIMEDKRCTIIASGGIEDHVHLLVRLHQQIDVAEAANYLKSNSSRFVRQEIRPRDGFAWQEGYGAFSVSITHKLHLIDYIHGQRQHHSAVNSLVEYKDLLEKHEIEFEESMLD